MSASQLGKIVIYLNEQTKLLCFCWLILSLFGLCAVNIPQVLVLEKVQKIDTENYHASNTAPSVSLDWLLKLDILWLVALLRACQESDQSSGKPKCVFNSSGKTFFSTPEVLETPQFQFDKSMSVAANCLFHSRMYAHVQLNVWWIWSTWLMFPVNISVKMELSAVKFREKC